MSFLKLREQIQKHEGFREKPYKDTEGHTTLGYGFNVDAGVNKDFATHILNYQLTEAVGAAEKAFPWYKELSVPRKAVVVNMIFNLGLKGFKKFKKMIGAIKKEDHENVVAEMLDSKWAHQVKGRAWELADQWRDDVIL